MARTQSKVADSSTDTRFLILSDEVSLGATDPLEFEDMAKTLERIILASRESAPFTASIEAGWGAGKSTLMRRLERRLQGKAPDQRGEVAPTARTVWFNAWTAPESGVLEGLVRSVLTELDTNLIRRVARKRNMLRGLGVGASVVGGFLGFRNIVDSLWAKASVDPKQRNELNDFVREAMNEWVKKGTTEAARKQARERLVVVFIDDLDRCSAAAVMQIFEAMKLYLNAPGFVFVLGWDTEQVLRAVATTKGAEDRLPQRYVEKIVQLGFRIRRPTEEQLKTLAQSYCDKAGLTDEQLRPEHKQLLISTTDGNPRQLKRFINRLILLYELTDVGVEAEVLILLMVLQASYEGFYRHLADVTGESDKSNPLVQFSEYHEARDALNRGLSFRVVEIIKASGYEVGDDGPGPEEVFRSYERDLPAEYTVLAVDRKFVELVALMSPDDKRKLRRLARSKEVQALESSAPNDSSTSSQAVDNADVVPPGTTVLWVDDHPTPDDQALLPRGVELLVATSTTEARRILQSRSGKVDLLISDMGRDDPADDGLTGLRDFRADGLYDGPVVFYTSRPTSGQMEQAGELHAAVATTPWQLREQLGQHLPVQPSPQQAS